MTRQYFGEPISRNEDARLLTGQALFVDDVQLPRMAHVAYVRSPFAHARINSIDVGQARSLDGVIAIYTADELGDYWRRGPLLVSPPPIERCTRREHPADPRRSGAEPECPRHPGEG